MSFVSESQNLPLWQLGTDAGLRADGTIRECTSWNARNFFIQEIKNQSPCRPTESGSDSTSPEYGVRLVTETVRVRGILRYLPSENRVVTGKSFRIRTRSELSST